MKSLLKTFVLSSLLLLTGINFVLSGRETIFDKKINIEKEIIYNIPKAPYLCDSISSLDKKLVSIGDGKLYCETEGNGIPIVLVSGGPGCTHQIFHPFFSRAKDFAKIIYYDQRGTGKSDSDPTKEKYTTDKAVEDLENLRKALKIDKWIVLGHSYGGILAQMYAIKYPQNLYGLILVTAEPAPDLSHTREYDFMSEKEIKVCNKLSDEYGQGKITLEQLVYNSFLNGDWKRQYYYKPTKDEIARIALYEWKPAEGFAEAINSNLEDINLEGKFKNFKVPLLIMESKWDLTWPEDKPEKFSKNHPNAEMVMFEKSGHNPFMDEEEKFFTELKNFVKKISSSVVIFLNGTSSAGKTALTAEIQKLGQYEKVNVDEDFEEPFMQAAINYIKEKTGVEATFDNLPEVAEQLTKEGRLTKRDDKAIESLAKPIFINMLKKIKDYATAGKDIIVDMLVENERNFRDFYESLHALNVAFILTYCPFTKLAERVRQRISEKDPRTFTQVFVQFSRLYKAAQPVDTPILGTLTAEEVKQNCKLAEKDEPWIFEEMELGSFDELTPTVLKNLSLDKNESIQITPRFKYDLIVNTGINTPQQCAQQIKNFIESETEFTAFKENYEKLQARSCWRKAKSWWIKTKNWIQAKFVQRKTFVQIRKNKFRLLRG
jgi:proline iminopeptidase